MKRPAARARRIERGYVLLELVLALTLALLLLSGVMVTLLHGSRRAARLTDVAGERQSARAAVQLIEREIRMAGSGWGRADVECNDSAGAPDTLRAVNPGYSPAGDDSLVLVGAWQASTTLSRPMALPTSATTVASSAGFAPGDLFVVTSPGLGRAHMLMCTGVPDATTLAHAAASPYNRSDATHLLNTWPAAGGYAAQATNVFKVTITSYYIDGTSFRRPALMRHEYGQAPQVAAHDVDGFRVWYRMQDGRWTRDPADLSAVAGISPVVLTNVADAGLPAVRDSVWAVAQPRTF